MVYRYADGPVDPRLAGRLARRLRPRRRARRSVLDAVRGADRAAVHRGRSARRRGRRDRPSRPVSRSPAACTARCTGGGCGRCASSPGSARPRRPTERFRYLLDHGQTGLSTAFDMPSLMGHDSDHPRSLGEVGREGVAVDTVLDMETLFRGIALGRRDGVDDDQRAGGDHAGLLRGRGRASGRAERRVSAARSRPTSSRSTSRRRSGASRSTRRCGS